MGSEALNANASKLFTLPGHWSEKVQAGGLFINVNSVLEKLIPQDYLVYT